MSNPHDLILNEHVIETLEKDKGSEAKLLSWSIEDFVKAGDNFATKVTSIKVKALINGNEEDLSYVVKLNGCKQSEAWNTMTLDLFLHESEFFLRIAPRINKYLTSNNPLKTPRCYFASCEPGKEVLICNDLRKDGFKMFDKRYGMDVPHTTLLLKELARMHAAGHLLVSQNSAEDIKNDHPALKKNFFMGSSGQMGREMFKSMLTSQFDLAMGLICGYEGYEKVTEFLAENKPLAMEKLEAHINDISNNKFITICHGDCWNNNFLFR